MVGLRRPTSPKSGQVPLAPRSARDGRLETNDVAARQEGIANEGRALHEPQAVARLLVSTRVLAWLTTSPWCNDPPLTDPVASYLRTLRSEGWMIREASPRKFVIWRGETLYGRRRKLLVLPNRGVRLRPLERSAVAAALLAPTILRAFDGAPRRGRAQARGPLRLPARIPRRHGRTASPSDRRGPQDPRCARPIMGLSSRSAFLSSAQRRWMARAFRDLSSRKEEGRNRRERP